MDSLAIGSDLRGFEIEGILGRGGFGIVYRARHRELGTRFAIKEYFPSEIATRHGTRVVPRAPTFKHDYMDGLRRFKEEALRLIEFSNCPSIVSCRDFFRRNGTAYLVMVYVDGLPLSDLLRGREAQERPFDEADLLAVMLPLLEGLAVVHTADVLHRDIKPSNILIRYSDSQPILIDFGAAKQAAAELTKSFAPYTPGYAALEQVGDGTLGSWTDVYGLGALMWRMVAKGIPPTPVRIEQRALAMLKGTADPLPSAAKLGEGRFPAQILKAIDNCLAVDEDDRIQECYELVRLLDPETNYRTQRKNITSSLLVGTELHWAAWLGRHKKILKLVDTGAELNPGSVDGMTPLHWAAWAGRISCLRVLIERGATIDAKDNRGRTPLHRSVLAGRIKSFACLTEAGADMEARDKKGRGMSELAVLSRKSGMLEAVIAAGADLSTNDSHGTTLLHIAAEVGSPEQIATLLDYGLEIEARDRSQWTPLHYAASEDRPTNLEKLVKAGADVDPLTDKGRTPLQIAAWFGMAENVRILTDFGADVNRPSKSYKYGQTRVTPLQLAARKGSRDTILALLDAHADIHAVDSRFRGTALHWAAFGRHPEAIAILLDAGIDPKCRAMGGATPLHWLGSRRNWKCLEGALMYTWDSKGTIGYSRDSEVYGIESIPASIHRLLQAGAEIEARTKQGATPLLWSVMGRPDEPADTKATKALIVSGATVESRLHNGRTPLHLASHADVIELLIQSGADLNAEDNDGNTPLHIESRCPDTYLLFESREKVHRLITSGANMHARNQQGCTPLHSAARSLNHIVMKALIAAGGEVEVRDTQSNTPLLDACKASAGEVHMDRTARYAMAFHTITNLIEAGANVHARDKRGFTALHFASGSSYHEAVKALIAAGSDVDVQHEASNATPLLLACCPHLSRHYSEPPKEKWIFQTIKVLLESGASPRVRFKESVAPSLYGGRSPLHLAVRGLGSKVVSLLSKTSTDMDATDIDGNVPLALVKTVDRKEARLKIDSLISGGSDVRLWAECDEDALHKASLVGSAQGINTLVDVGVPIDSTTQAGETPLYCAARCAEVQSVKILLQLGCDVGCCDNNGLTALHAVAQLPREAVIEGDNSDAHMRIIQAQVEQTIALLCDAGCNPNHRVKSRSQSTPLHLIGQFHMRRIVRPHMLSEFLMEEICKRAGTVVSALIEHGADPNTQDRLGRTPLHIAALWGSPDCIAALILAGANIHARSNDNSTALHFAAVQHVGDMDEDDTQLILPYPHFDPIKESKDTLECQYYRMIKESVQSLIKVGSVLHARDKMGRTPLHRACESGTPETIDAILDAGGDPQVRDEYGRLPWDYLRFRKEIQSIDSPMRFDDVYTRIDRQRRLF